MRRAFAIALVAVTVLLPACGGSDEPQSDTEQIRDVVSQFHAAFSGGDYGKACELLHSRRREQLEFGRGQTCEDILESAADSVESRLIEALADVKITYVTITKGAEDFALVGVEGPGVGASQAELQRDGERGWRVSESPAGL